MDHPDNFPALGHHGGDSSAEVIRAIAAPALGALFVDPPRAGVVSAWYGHVPFAFWLMAAARPKMFVELGTHNGVSYAAFCGAVVESGIEARCFAVDTWKGDEHAGYYDESVFNDLMAFHDARYSAFSRMLRMTFEEAADAFADGTVDLLHIDGCHAYEAVRHDFETWRPKLSPRAIVLFHDINVRERHFGVWRLWDELKALYPAFEFFHDHGLGVLAVGAEIPEPVDALCSVTDLGAITTIRGRFALAGRRCALESKIAEQDRAMRDVQARLTAAEKAVEASGQILAESEALGRRLAEAEAERDRYVIECENERVARQDAEHQLRIAARDERRTQVKKAAEVERQRTVEAERDRARSDRDVALAASRQAHANAASLTAQLAEARRLHAAEKARHSDEEYRLQQHLIHVQRVLEGVSQSTTWRLLGPVRIAAALVPRSARMALRLGLKVAWWCATPWRLPARLGLRRVMPEIEQTSPVTPQAQEPVVNQALRAEPIDALGETTVPSVTSLEIVPIETQTRIQRRGLGFHLPSPRLSVAVGLVTYNNDHRELARCLESARNALARLGGAGQILVIDNGAVSDVPSDVTRLPGFGNIGFGAAHNRLMEAAFANGADLYVATNPDGAFHPEALLCLARMSDAQEGRALVEAIQFPAEHPKTYDPVTFDTPWASGACLGIPKAIFDVIGGFDESLFMYCEDVDLSWRARANGFSVLLNPLATFMHAVTNRVTDGRVYEMMLQSGHLLARKWGDERFADWTASQLANLGAEIPCVSITPVPESWRSIPDFSRQFSFAPVRW